LGVFQVFFVGMFVFRLKMGAPMSTCEVWARWIRKNRQKMTKNEAKTSKKFVKTRAFLAKMSKN